MGAFQLTNSFSVFAGGVAIYLLARKRIRAALQTFLFTSLAFSIAINVLGYYLWLAEDNVFIRQFEPLFAGPMTEGYGDVGSIGALSQMAGRVSSVFPHSQAYALYNLLVFALGIFGLFFYI